MPSLEIDPQTLLEQHRAYLKLLVRLSLHQHLHAKVNASDVVQQTFLEAQRSLDRFQGTTSGELTAWLRKILVVHFTNNVVVSTYFWYRRKKNSWSEWKGGRYAWTQAHASYLS